MSPLELTQMLRREIPLTEALGLTVSEITEQTLTTTGPFEANKNLHHTVFAGSIYCFATLAAWSLVHSYLHTQRIKGSIVLHDAHITYKRPITNQPTAIAQLPSSETLEQFKTTLESKQKSKLAIKATLHENGKLTAVFDGVFVVIQEKS